MTTIAELIASGRADRLLASGFGTFDEDLHPRDENGKFTSGSGGGASPAKEKTNPLVGPKLVTRTDEMREAALREQSTNPKDWKVDPAKVPDTLNPRNTLDKLPQGESKPLDQHRVGEPTNFSHSQPAIPTANDDRGKGEYEKHRAGREDWPAWEDLAKEGRDPYNQAADAKSERRAARTAKEERNTSRSQTEYTSRKGAVESELKRITEGLAKHAERALGAPVAWGHSGDLQGVYAKLKDIADMLNQTGEYASANAAPPDMSKPNRSIPSRPRIPTLEERLDDLHYKK